MVSKLYKSVLIFFLSLCFCYVKANSINNVKEKYNQWLDSSGLGKILKADSLAVRYQNAGNDTTGKKTFILYFSFSGYYKFPARAWYLVKGEFDRRRIDIREQLRQRLSQLLRSPVNASFQIIIPMDDLSFKGINKARELKALNFDFEKTLAYTLVNQYVVLRKLGSLIPFEKALRKLFEGYSHPPNSTVNVTQLKETSDGIIFHISNAYGEATHASYYELIVIDVDLTPRLTERKDTVSEITFRILNLQYAGGIGKSPTKDEDYDGDIESDFPGRVQDYFNELEKQIKKIVK